jgi:glycosyltransferase involved in cell wall biosynthesis
MKLMFLIPHISDGGAEKILSDLSFNLGLGEVVLVVFEEKPGYPFQGRLISMDLPIEKHSMAARVIGFIRRIFRLRRLVRSERPDCVISFMGEANFINALVGARPILTVHNHLSSLFHLRGRLEVRIFEFLLRTLYRMATIVAVSEAVKQDLVQYFRISEDRVVVILTAIDYEEIHRKAAEEVTCPWPGGAPVIVTAGRLHPQKGQWHLLRAFAEVRKKMACRLAILGTGELESYLREVARDLGVEKDVYFLGWQENPFKFLSRADLFVLSSVSEGLGLVVMEAMACGLPVITTNCPGPTELIAPGGKEEFGILVPPVDEKMYAAADLLTNAERAMADAMHKVLNDLSLRRKLISAGARRLRELDRATFFEKYRQVIRSVSRNAS